MKLLFLELVLAVLGPVSFGFPKAEDDLKGVSALGPAPISYPEMVSKIKNPKCKLHLGNSKETFVRNFAEKEAPRHQRDSEIKYKVFHGSGKVVVKRSVRPVDKEEHPFKIVHENSKYPAKPYIIKANKEKQRHQAHDSKKFKRAVRPIEEEGRRKIDPLIGIDWNAVPIIAAKYKAEKHHKAHDSKKFKRAVRPVEEEGHHKIEPLIGIDWNAVPIIEEKHKEGKHHKAHDSKKCKSHKTGYEKRKLKQSEEA